MYANDNDNYLKLIIKYDIYFINYLSRKHPWLCVCGGIFNTSLHLVLHVRLRLMDSEMKRDNNLKLQLDRVLSHS